MPISPDAIVMAMILCLALGYAAAAALPIVGFARLLWRSQRDLAVAIGKVQARGGKTNTTIGDDNEAKADIRALPLARRRAAIWDIVLVGLGLAIGAFTSIAALPGMLVP